MTEFRCRPNPSGTVQQCTFCGAPGQWSHAGLQGTFATPAGHTVRSDGTLDCPRSVGTRDADAPRWSWQAGEATVAVEASEGSGTGTS